MSTKTIFQSIKDALKQENDKDSNILRFEVGNTYTVRLLPYVKDPAKTFFHHYMHGWTSFATGEYVRALGPETFGERNPLSEERFRVLRVGTEAEKARIKLIRRSERWLVNVYVVSDPKKPENNGKVKVISYGKQLHTVINDAIEGEDSEGLGARVFDLSPNGVNLKIKVEQQGDFPSFVSSKFTMPSALPDMTDAKIEQILNSTYELDKIMTVKSYDEIKKMLAEHFYVEGAGATPPAKKEKDTGSQETNTKAQPEVKPDVTPKASKTVTSDEDVKRLLDELEDETK